jgi:hypothetical protein
MIGDLHVHGHCTIGDRLSYESDIAPDLAIPYCCTELKMGFTTLIGNIGQRKGVKYSPLADYHEGKKFLDRFSHKFPGFVLVPAIEVETSIGHMNILGIEQEPDPSMSFEELLEWIRDNNGLSVAVHPFDARGDGIGKNASKTDCIEVFNSINIDRISNLMAQMFAEKHNLTGIAVSDGHTYPDSIGLGTIKVHARPTVEGILESIRKREFEIASMRYLDQPKYIEWVWLRLKNSREDALSYVRNKPGLNALLPLARYLCDSFLEDPNKEIWKAIFGATLRYYKLRNGIRYMGYKAAHVI